MTKTKPNFAVKINTASQHLSVKQFYHCVMITTQAAQRFLFPAKSYQSAKSCEMKLIAVNWWFTAGLRRPPQVQHVAVKKADAVRIAFHAH